MPKYKPTNDDLWSTRPCAMCGRDVVLEKHDTCSDWCEMHYQEYRDWVDEDYFMTQRLIDSG